MILNNKANKLSNLMKLIKKVDMAQMKKCEKDLLHLYLIRCLLTLSLKSMFLCKTTSTFNKWFLHQLSNCESSIRRQETKILSLSPK